MMSRQPRKLVFRRLPWNQGTRFSKKISYSIQFACFFPNFSRVTLIKCKTQWNGVSFRQYHTNKWLLDEKKERTPLLRKELEVLLQDFLPNLLCGIPKKKGLVIFSKEILIFSFSIFDFSKLILDFFFEKMANSCISNLEKQAFLIL